MNKPIVIACTGKRGAGKSEFVKMLVANYGFVDVKFADPLKNMLRAMYSTAGLDPTTIERKIEGDLKEQTCDYLLGHTPRHAMQTLGTEWRKMIATELWAEMLVRRVMSGDYGDRIAISDYRFPDEEGVALSTLDAKVVRITRPTADAVNDKASQHASEALIDKIVADTILHNDGTLNDLRSKIGSYMKDEFNLSK